MNPKHLIDFAKLITPINAHSFESATDIIARLKFIGTWQPGDKLDVKNMRIESNNLFTPLKRLFNGEGRETTLAFVYNTVERAFAIMYSLAATDKASDTLVCGHILIDMHTAIGGITNLQTTYKDDMMYVCNLQTMIQTIQAKLIDVKTRYPSIWKLYDEHVSAGVTSGYAATTTPPIAAVTTLSEPAAPSSTSATSTFFSNKSKKDH